MAIERSKVFADNLLSWPKEMRDELAPLIADMKQLVSAGLELEKSFKGAKTLGELSKSTDALNESQAKLNNTQRQIIVTVDKATQSLIGKNAEELELIKVTKATEIAVAKQSKAYQDQKKVLDSVNTTTKQHAAIGDQDAKTLNKSNASIKELTAALNINRAAYAALSNEEERSSASGQELLSVIEQQTAEVDELKKSMGQFQQNVGNYEGAMVDLKEQLKAANDEMAGISATLGQNSPEFAEAAARAGELKNEIGDLANATKAVSGTPIEKLAGSFDLLKGKVFALDLKGATAGISGMANAVKGISFKQAIDGVGGFGKAMVGLGRALLTNPIFLIASIVIGIGVALVALKDKVKFISDAFAFLGKVFDVIVESAMRLSDAIAGTSFVADQAAKDTIKAAKEQAEAVGRLYDRQIKMAEAAGKSTTELEKQRAAAIEQAYKVVKENYDKISILSEDEQKEREENLRNLEDVSDERIAIGLRELEEVKKIAKERAKVAEELRLKEAGDLLKLEQWRRSVVIDSQKEILASERSGFSNRLNAAAVIYQKSVDMAVAERDAIINQKDVTDSAVIMAEEQKNQTLLDLRKQYLTDVKNLASPSDLQDLKATKALTDAKKLQVNFEKSLEDVRVKNANKENDRHTARMEQLRKEQKEMEAQQLAISAIGELFGEQQRVLSEKIAAEEAQKDAALAAEDERLKKQLKGFKGTSEERAAIEEASDARKEMIEKQAAKRQEELDRKRKESVRRQAIFENSITLVRTIAAGIEAVTKAFTAGPIIGAVIAASYGALVAVQVQKLKSLAIPAAEHGIEGHKGGLIIAGEKGHELIKMPGGRLGMTGNTAGLYNLPKGTDILNHKETVRWLAAQHAFDSLNGGGRQDNDTDRVERGIAELTKVVRNKREWIVGPNGVEGHRVRGVRVSYRNKMRNA